MTEGMPLLSGPPPSVVSNEPETSCRKCGKEFHLFTRSRQCNHCGYSYCSSCSDYQALMPRNSQDSGYDVMHVCAYCVENLNITAAGRAKLRSMPLARLKKYTDAYNLKVKGAIEKDDVIDAIINARGSHGCLPAENEDYYRRYSIPKKQQGRNPNFFSRTFGQDQPQAPQQAPPPPRREPETRTEFRRPDLEPDRPTQRQQQGSRQQQPQQSRQQQPQQQRRQQMPRYPPSRPQAARPTPQHVPYSRPFPPSTSAPQFQYRPPSTPAQAPPHPPSSIPPRPATTAPTPPRERVPELDELFQMSQEQISSLSIHTLKDLLFHNHVHAGLILEKADLVAKVMGLIEQEKRDRERDAILRAREEEEYLERQRAAMEEHKAKQEKEKQEKERQETAEALKNEGAGEDDPSTASTSPKPLPPKAQAMAATLERTGLCVICQDEDANIAVVDCGHLAMCRGCSDLIMKTSRECPLCRTRIVTEARLLRIFKP